MAEPVVTVEGLDLRVKGRTLLQDVNFELPAHGITALMGPVGSGKSTLMKWLCCKTDPKAISWEAERAEYFFRPLSEDHAPCLFPQLHTRSIDETMSLLDEQLNLNPALLCVDEVTARLTERNTRTVLERLHLIAQSRALLLVSHNQAHMKEFADNVMLLAVGALQEFTPAAEFFREPRSEAGRQFLGTGSVSVPNTNTPSRHLRSDLRALPEAVRKDASDDRFGLRAIYDGKLYVQTSKAAQWPTSAEINHLFRSGITTLVLFGLPDPDLTAKLNASGIDAVWCSKLEPDITIPACTNLCGEIQVRLDSGETLAYLRRGEDPSAAHAISFQLVNMGIPAQTAAAICARIMGLQEISPLEEQFLWDLELALDLERDGLGMELDHKRDVPDIGWIEAQEARPRQARETGPKRPHRAHELPSVGRGPHEHGPKPRIAAKTSGVPPLSAGNPPQ